MVDDADPRTWTKDLPLTPDARISQMVSRESRDLLAYFLRRVGNREDAADLLAECFVVLWRRRGSVPTEDTAARMWAFGVARNILAAHRRGATRRQELAEELRFWLRSSESPMAPESVDVQVALQDLRPLDREIVTLHYWEGFSLEEISKVLRKPSATVRSRLLRARRQLRAQLSPEIGDEHDS